MKTKKLFQLLSFTSITGTIFYYNELRESQELKKTDQLLNVILFSRHGVNN